MSEKNNGVTQGGDGQVERAAPAPGGSQRDILDIEGAAELLGISQKTFNKVLHSQDMPGRKIGREWKFSRRALIEWVGSGRSRDFYNKEDEGESDAEVTPAKPPTRERTRRTAGWNIEY